LSFELGDFLFQPHGTGLGSCWFLPIGSIECRQVTADARFNFFHSPFQFGAAGQPHQLDVALGFSFQPSARLNAAEIAVDIAG
jgi:hypothetical protein